MFSIEIVSGFRGGSVSLLADSLDFLGDAANYGISLVVLGLSVTARANASRIKALSMGAFGVWVIGVAIWNLTSSVMPSIPTMGIVGLSALLANCSVALLLFTYRDGDSNMRSVWLCTRNDALGNVAVLLAALGVFGTGAGWPDLAVAAIMAMLALTSAVKILRQANAESSAGARDSSVKSESVAPRL
jgi:Co/Zn/Cd efflux system component